MASPRSLGTDQLLAAYARGDFPMASEETGEIAWWSPDPRAILPLDGLRVDRRLARLASSGRFESRLDTAFDDVVRACAAPTSKRQESWLDERLIEAHVRLHAEGWAHSVEAWRDGALVGGLYGARIGAAFFAESMFHRADLGGSGASKVCLVRLVERLRAGGFELLDVQFLTPHLESLGCVEIPRGEYLARLRRAVPKPARWPVP